MRVCISVVCISLLCFCTTSVQAQEKPEWRPAVLPHTWTTVITVKGRRLESHVSLIANEGVLLSVREKCAGRNSYTVVMWTPGNIAGGIINCNKTTDFTMGTEEIEKYLQPLPTPVEEHLKKMRKKRYVPEGDNEIASRQHRRLIALRA